MKPESTPVSPTKPSGPRPLTRGPELTRALTYGGPLAAGMILHALFNLIDFWICAQLGSDGINAAGIVDIIMMIPSVVANGICTASIAVIARNYGLKRLDRAAIASWNAFFLMIGLGILTGWVGYFFGDLMLQAYLSGGREMEWAHEYLMISAFGSVSMFMLLQVTSVLRAAGETAWPTVIFFMCTALNALGDVLLVFGYEPLGIPRFNVAGAAIASVIARGLGVSFGFYLLLRKRPDTRLPLNALRLSVTEVWRLLRIGVPSSAQLVARVLAVYLLASIVESTSPSARPAYIICVRLDMLAMFCCLGWGAGASTLVGQNMGAGKPNRAERAGWYCTLLGAMMMIVVASLFILFARPVVGFFAEQIVTESANGAVTVEEEETKQLGEQYLTTIAFTYPFIAISTILALSFNGAGSTKTPLLFDSVVMLLLLIPAARMAAHSDLQSLWWVIAAANTLLALPYLIWFRFGHWRSKQI